MMTTHLLLIALINYAFAFSMNTHQHHYNRAGRLQSQTNDESLLSDVETLQPCLTSITAYLVVL